MIRETFDPILLEETVPVTLTGEQKQLIRAVLDTSSSDTRFAEKAYLAILKIVESGTVEVPPDTELDEAVVDSVAPNTGVAGTSVPITVNGHNFVDGDSIYVDGMPVDTTFVSDTQLTGSVDLTGLTEAVDLPVSVRNSNELMFSVTVAE